MSTDKSSTRLYHDLEQCWNVGTYEWWPEADRLTWSPELVRIYGLERAPRAEQVFTARVHPEDRLRVEGETSAFLGSDAASYSHIFRIVRPDGCTRVILDRGAIERDMSGQVRVIRGINIDLTDEISLGRRSLLPTAADHGQAPEVSRTCPPHAAPALIFEWDIHRMSKLERIAADLAEGNAMLAALFDDAPMGLGMWDREFRFLRVNRELAAMNGMSPEDHIGHRPDEILPDLAGLDEVYRRWGQILETGEPWRGVEISGETPAEPGHLRHWEEDFFPVKTGDRIIGIAAVVQETTRRKLAEDDLRASEGRYRTLFQSIDQGFCVLELRFDGPGGRTDYRVVEANPAFYDRTGFPKSILGQWMREVAPALEEHWYETYGGVAQTGTPIRFEQQSDLLGRWFNVYAFPIGVQSDRRVGVLFNDISERKRREKHTQMLMHEVNHRSQNLLSLVQVIARQTASPEERSFVDRFDARIRALGAAQDLLLQNAWDAISVEVLVRSQLAHFSNLVGQRITIEGPPLALTPEVTQSIGMAVHELATNAAKYGALSDAVGHVSICWSVAPDANLTQRFLMSWRERDGPPVAPPKRFGFGSMVTKRMVEASTGGKVSVVFDPAGLEWSLSCPVANAIGT